MPFETLLVEQHGPVTLVRLNRPQALNALNSAVLADLVTAYAAYDADAGQRCLVLTGSDKAFAAGADIKEMQPKGFAEMFGENFFAGFERVTATRKPWLAAVAGFALGGGCELAMMADFIIAADTAKFGQPEIKLGVAPGMGGSQRLTRAVGKAKAMEMCLTGRMMDATEAERAGLVTRVVPAAELLDDALKTAAAIARDAAAGGDRQQGDGERGVRDRAGARAVVRAAAVQRPGRDRGQARRHGGIRGKAAGDLERPLNDDVLVQRDRRLGRIRLNRPKALNSLTTGMVRTIRAALDQFGSDDAVAGRADRWLRRAGAVRRRRHSGAV